MPNSKYRFANREILRKIAVLLLIFTTALQSSAQNYKICFSGEGGSTFVDSVKIENITQFTSLTISGNDTLHLKELVGINDFDLGNEYSLQIFPNPMNEKCLLRFESPLSGFSNIEIYSINGKKILQDRFFLSTGWNSFQISGLSYGGYTVRIHSDNWTKYVKLLSTFANAKSPHISQIADDNNPLSRGELKGVQSLIPMQYNDGDQLLLTGYSGIYSTVVPLIPTQNQAVIFNFIGCTDLDGNNYPTVTIGDQIWMARNLNIGIRINGTEEQTNNGIIEKYCYDNGADFCSTYGGLYQWGEIMQYQTTHGIQGICPPNWHLPTWEEWDTLSTFLEEFIAGGKLKTTGTIEAGNGLWHTPNIGATNETGFSALPSGHRFPDDGLFYSIGLYCAWWSSSESYPGFAWTRYIHFDDENLRHWGLSFSRGHSVRCIFDVNDEESKQKSLQINPNQ